MGLTSHTSADMVCSVAVLREVLSSQSVVLQGMDDRPELPDNRVIHVHPW